VVEEAGFDELLDSVRGRVDEIESLHRTRELTVCLPNHRRLMFSLILEMVHLVQGHRQG
jgi:hypothetical protein